MHRGLTPRAVTAELLRLWRTASGHRVCPGSVIPDAVQELIKGLKGHAGSFHSDFENQSPLVERDGPALGRVSLELTRRLLHGPIRYAERRRVTRSPWDAN